MIESKATEPNETTKATTRPATIQVELDFDSGESRPRSNGVQLILPNPKDADINLHVSRRDTLEFESNQAFQIKIIPKDHEGIRPGPDMNPFDLTKDKFEADSVEQHGIHRVVCGAVDPEFLNQKLPCSYKYVATTRLTASTKKLNARFQSREIDPHIILDT
jgi:hypothetical protein